MFEENSIKKVNQSIFSKNFRKPRFQDYCFSNIHKIVRNLFGIEQKNTEINLGFNQKFSNVVVFFIDGFGWRFLEKFSGAHKTLAEITKHGLVTKLTAQFPSTTACHLTSIHTGIPVYETGIYEWYYYEPVIDDIISPLLFSKNSDNQRETLVTSGFYPKQIFPFKSFYSQLKEHNVSSHIFQNKNYTPSSYSNVMFEDASIYRYNSQDQGVKALFQALTTAQGLNYFFIYTDSFDSVSHDFGPQSKELDDEFQKIFSFIEAEFFSKVSSNSDTMLLFTADHGQVEINPATTIYLDQVCPEMKWHIKKNQVGKLLVPAGSSRDLFLHINDADSLYVKELLTEKLFGKAEVFTINELIKAGIFGSEKVSKRFIDRVGNIVILPYAGESVFWLGENSMYKQKFKGHHGGLTPQEMDIPLISYQL